MDNIFYDESLHDNCLEVMRLMIKLHVEFCTRVPSPDISGHLLREAELMNEAIQDKSANAYEVIELYATMLQDLEEVGNVMNFLKLPLLFLMKEIHGQSKEE